MWRWRRPERNELRIFRRDPNHLRLRHRRCLSPDGIREHGGWVCAGDAHINVLRQLADRDFLAEKTISIQMLSTALENLREILYRYYKDSDADTLRDISMREIAFIQVGRNRLLIRKRIAGGRGIAAPRV